MKWLKLHLKQMLLWTSDVVCPVTFVKTKVALDELDDNGDGTFEMYIKKVGE